MSPTAKSLFSTMEAARFQFVQVEGNYEAEEHGVVEFLIVSDVVDRMQSVVGPRINPWKVIAILCDGTWAGAEAASFVRMTTDDRYDKLISSPEVG